MASKNMHVAYAKNSAHWTINCLGSVNGNQATNELGKEIWDRFVILNTSTLYKGAWWLLKLMEG